MSENMEVGCSGLLQSIGEAMLAGGIGGDEFRDQFTVFRASIENLILGDMDVELVRSQRDEFSE